MKMFVYTVMLLFVLQTPQDTILSLTNTHRKTPLTKNDLLMKMAQAHTDNLAKQDRYGDDGNGHILDGKGFEDRLKVSGYLCKIAGENVAMNGGYKDPFVQVVDAWMKSDAHRRNIINEEFTEIGIGASQSKSGKWYYCQVFGRPR